MASLISVVLGRLCEPKVLNLFNYCKRGRAGKTESKTFLLKETLASVSLPSHLYRVSAQISAVQPAIPVLWHASPPASPTLKQCLSLPLYFLSRPISTLARLDLPTPIGPMIMMRGQGYLEHYWLKEMQYTDAML